MCVGIDFDGAGAQQLNGRRGHGAEGGNGRIG